MDYNSLLENFRSSLNHFERGLFEFLPSLIGAALTFLVGFLVAKLLRAAVVRFINNVHRLIPDQEIQGPGYFSACGGRAVRQYRLTGVGSYHARFGTA